MQGMLAPIDIARMEEARRVAGCGDIATITVPLCGGIMTYNGPDAFENVATGLAMDQEFTADDCERLFAFYAEHGVTPEVEVCPFAHESLIKRLGERGMVIKEFSNVLARTLVEGEDPRTMTPNPWDPALEIRPVERDDEDMIRTFAITSTSGFLKPGQEATQTMLDWSGRIVAHPRSRAFIAYVDGEVAGAGSMESAPPVSAVFGMTTLPAFRRRGVQAAMIAHRLSAARADGCEVGIIHSRPGIATERNAARMGFFNAYTLATLTAAPQGS